MGGTRNAFTSQDDEYLAQYIAKYHPGVKGRQGNKLYENLVEQPNRWSWSTRHPWMSWRERYKKNQTQFDRKIAKIQKIKQAVPKVKKAEGPPVQKETDQANEAGNASERDAGPSNAKKPDASRVEKKKLENPNGARQARDATALSTDSGYASTSKRKDNTTSGPTIEQQVKEQEQEERLDQKDAAILSDTGVAEGEVVADSEEEDGEEVDDEDEDALPKEPVGDEDYMHELFGSSDGDDEDEDEEDGEDEDEETEDGETEDEEAPQEVLPTPSSSTGEYADIYPNIADVPDPAMSQPEPQMPGSLDSERPIVLSQEPTPPKSATRSRQSSPLSMQPPPPAQRPAQQPPQKRALKRKIVDEDPFADNTPPRSSPPTPRERPIISTKSRKPPVLHEGHFRNTYVQDGSGWPPKRRKKNPVQDDVEMVEPEGEPHARPPPDESLSIVAAHKSAPSKPNSQQQQADRPIPRPRKEPMVNAVASSSRVKLPPPIASRPQDPVSQPPASRVEPPAPKRQKVDHNLVKPFPMLPQVPDRSNPVMPVAANTPASSDVFTSKTRKGKQRADPKSPLRIDFRASLQKRHGALRQSRRSSLSGLTSISATHSVAQSSSVGPSRVDNLRRRESGASSISRRSRLSVVSVDDANLLSLVKQEMQELVDMYGFSMAFVESTHKATRSLEKARFVLERCRLAVESTREALGKAMPGLFGGEDERSGGEDEDEEVPDGIIPNGAEHIILGDKEKKKVTGKALERTGIQSEPQAQSRSQSQARTSSIRRSRPSLNIKRLPSDEEPLSDFSPPSKTRAARYAKLKKEGREEEALAATLTGSQPRRSGHLERMQRDLEKEVHAGSPMNVEPSPTPRMREGRAAETEGQHGYGREMRRSKGALPSSPPHDVEDEEMDEMDVYSDAAVGHLTLAVDPLIDAEPTVQVKDEDDPALLALMEEHRKLSAEVTKKKHKAMKRFEMDNDPDALRRWSVEWIMERVEESRRAQEWRVEEMKRIEDSQASEERMLVDGMKGLSP